MGPSTGYDLGGKKKGCYDFTSYQGSSIVCKNYGMVKRLVPLIYNSVFKKQITNTFGET